ncbi:MAG TPA: class I SAM-dependent methyltransferase [Beijerinckiaceae bacterium]|jgi:SAM-dependent methyltransferase
MDAPIPHFPRFVWPKNPPPLSPEQQRISDDFYKHWHEVLPKKYGAIERFNHGYPQKVLPDKERFRTLEIGAGIGGHIAEEDLSRQDYYCIEMRQHLADEIMRRFPQVKAVVGDCQQRMPFDDDFFDRVVVTHVLEHLTNLPAALDEVRRVLRPGGLFAVVLPCDPGLAYGFARKISSERMFRKRYGQSYEWFIRREHINSPDEILTLLRERFTVVDQTYWPLMIPLVDLNLCIGVTVKKG